MLRRYAQMMVLVSAVAAAIAVVAAVAAPVAQDKAKPAAASQKQPEVVNGSSDSWKINWGAKKTVLMKGNVKFTHGDTALTSDEVLWDEEAKVVTSPGAVHITDPQCDITGDKGAGYFKKRIGVVEGNVVMQLKPGKPDESSDPESIRGKLTKPTTITCSKLEYQYREKIASATGGVVFKQQERIAHADKAVYDEKKELLTLTGNVNGTDEYGQTFSAPGTVVMSLKKGDEWMEAQDGKASFRVNLDEE